MDLFFSTAYFIFIHIPNCLVDRRFCPRNICISKYDLVFFISPFSYRLKARLAQKKNILVFYFIFFRLVFKLFKIPLDSRKTESTTFGHSIGCWFNKTRVFPPVNWTLFSISLFTYTQLR